MGLAYSHPQLAANDVLDYQCDLLDPCHEQLLQRLGPNVGAFSDQGKNQILNEMQDCISNANLELVAEFQKVRIIYWAMFPVYIVCIFIYMILIIELLLVPSLIMMVVILIAVLGKAFVGRKLQAISEKWRGFVLAALQPKLQDWKTQFPAFTFTIIYPREEVSHCSTRSCGRGWATGWGGCKNYGQPDLIAFWIYLRITQGICQTTGYGPIFDSSEQQTIQVVVQQPVQTQTVVVQGAGGQMVAAHYAAVNGQQVLDANQPPQQYTQQQPQYAQQPQQTEQEYNLQQKQANGKLGYAPQAGTL